MLAITGRRADGFHELISVVVPLTWGDTLVVEPAAEDVLVCDAAEVPTDGSNLVLKAAKAFRAATGRPGAARFTLTKRIPMGAGLGGGSSDAVAALRALNQLAGVPLGISELAGLAAQLGSDCPLFLHDGPVVMRGRGERVEPVPTEAAARLRGRKVLVFKPAFGIPTAWAYAQLAADAPHGYVPAEQAEARVAAWLGHGAEAASRAGGGRRVAGGPDGEPPRLEHLLFNSMERPAFRKFTALPVLLEQLGRRFGLAPRMSGSGSACFALLSDDTPVADVVAAVHAAWGPTAIAVQTQLG
jgi:4-diphosphocytidyl-2-C-methyl-D-erythritol kinase